MNITIIGTGYVGLVTGTCFAEMGHYVTCLDIDQNKIDLLNQGRLPIYEPGLEEIVKRNIADGRLKFTSNYNVALNNTLVCFLAVPTPEGEDGSADLKYILHASQQIAKHMKSYLIIVDKSTVPAGTAQKVKAIIDEELRHRGVNVEFDVVSNPEFLKEGNAVADFMKPDRIVIGIDNIRAESTMKEIYAPFMLNHDRLIIMDTISAEMTKYAANAMLATRISFMNELSSVCETVGADINKVRLGVGSDKRIGNLFLYPGIGYGGSCFPKDVKALCKTARKNGHNLSILESVDTVNNEQKKVLGNKIIAYYADKGGVAGKTIAIWGLSFKPETDDIREAPSLVLIEQLTKKGALLRLFDPVAMAKVKKVIHDHTNLEWCHDEIDAANGADAIALVTEWRRFRFPDYTKLLSTMAGNTFFDGRNQYEPSDIAERGFDYISIGRRNIYATKSKL